MYQLDGFSITEIVTSDGQKSLEIKTLHKRFYQLEAGIRVNGARCRYIVHTFSGAQARARACVRAGATGGSAFFFGDPRIHIYTLVKKFCL
jgi:hypothetical protein